MIRITQSEIKSAAANNATYLRGMDYYSIGMVRTINYDEDEGIITARVRGNEDYHVEIYIDEDGCVDDAECTCPAFYEYIGNCKHITAVLLKALETYKYKHVIPFEGLADLVSLNKSPTAPETLKNDINYRPSKELVSNLLKNISSFSKENKEAINIKVYLYKSTTSFASPYIEMEIGTDRMYVVKDMEELANAILFKRELFFGKQFTLSMEKQHFRPEDQPFVDLILEAYQDDSHLHFGNSISFSKKTFTLTPSRFARFLEIANGMSNAYWKEFYDSNPVKISICRGLPPLFLKLQEGEHSIEMSFEQRAPIHVLNYSKDIFASDGVFYISTPEEALKVLPIIEVFQKSKGSPISLRDDDTATCIMEIFPQIKNLCKIDIDQKINRRLHVEPLTTTIWFDRYGDGISSKVIFKYGEIECNALEQPSLDPSDSILLVRDKKAEENIISDLKDSGFKVNDNLFVLFGEENIYDFLMDKISVMSESSEIYYSEAFSRLKVSKSPKLSGSVRLDEESNLLEISFNIDGIDVSEISDFIAALKEKKKYIRLRNGSFITIDSPEMHSTARLVEQLELAGNDTDSKILSLPKYRALYLDSVIKDYGRDHFSINSPFRQMVSNIKEPQDLEFQVPKELKGTLRDYQKAGFKWLKALSYYGFGGILADDMGLGKTLQAISLVISDYSIHNLPSLVICPTSLVYNWQEEIRKFAPGFKIAVLDGNREERLKLMEEISQSAFVITSYPLIRRDIDNIKDYNFAYCFLDEAQHIKNPGTINAKSVKQVRAQRYFALTGTPIENSLTELWSIFDFIMPGYLYSHNKFRTNYESPIVRNSDKAALEDLGKHIRPFILRRLKKDVLDELPEKIETRLLCEMTHEQKKVYLAYLSTARSLFEEEVKSKGFEKSQIKILSLLTRLRQICCHPSLFLESFKGSSGKIELLEEVLYDSISSGHRVLLFSQFTSMLEIIKANLKKNNISYYYIDGQTPSGERMKQVHDFNSGGADVFLISLKAGGTGLNLTGADTVIHYDPWWNPAVEDQASDRAHRIGQKKSVQVFKLVTKGTIEEKIYALQQKKRELVDSVITPGDSFINKMSLEDVRNLFND